MKENLIFFETITNVELPAGFETEFRKRSYKAYSKELKAVKGIHGLLNNLNIPTAVASSGPIEKIRLNLAITRLSEKFGDRIFSCYEIGSWKPDPEIYLHVAREMGFAPGECAVIEDSLAGVQAAISGGFDVFVFANEKNKVSINVPGATVFTEMSDLTRLLEIE